ncbi:thiol-disulfide isomerase/thioredoxin [Chitinophaga polysaccharea]|uniref:Thiol-disulfide isomerase/thioredoxin n=1 Tax=Chitinophaga polysaccharea TaxID=1293035 RepID=A0A561PQV7_9BACT|nr:TlpA disulfide reductase family protein [Chitinophaga polysaccharea]TWF40473.1 thiol-disulfide isomerase/thioredoxin [Chitinophaga polysaccharea]
MRRGYPDIILFTVVILLLSSCSKKTITFIGEHSLFTSNEFHRDSTDKIDLLIERRKRIKRETLVLRENHETIIHTKEPVFFYPMGLILSWRIAYPGDTIHVSENNYGSFIYHTSNRQRDITLFCTKLIDSCNFDLERRLLGKYYAENTPASLPKITTIAEIKQPLAILTTSRNNLADSLAAVYSLTRDFLDNKRYEIQADSLLKTYSLYKTLLKPTKNRDEWWKICQSFIHDLNALPVKTVSFFYFRRCAEELLSYVEAESNINSELKSTTDFINKYNLVNENFSGEARNYLLSDIIYQTLSKRLDIPSEYLHSYFKVCNNNQYKSEVRHQLKQKRKIDGIKRSTSRNDVLSIKTLKKSSIEDIIKQEKGNIILLDLWASWCVPCREEFPFLKALEKEYSGKAIKFIKISLDKEIEKWENASQNEAFIDNNYLLLDINRSAIITQYQIETIPRFILLDKQGVVINADAPPPSDGKLKTLIDQLLR